MEENYFKPLFLMGVFGNYFDDYEYNNLLEDEKEWMDYFDSCLYNPDERIRTASFEIMMLVLEIKESIDTPNEMSNKEAQKRKAEIYKNLKEEEKAMVEKFALSCINCMGIYSDERKEERRLNRKK